ncbi:MAG: hypothetical protein K2N90_10285 [Lachnospiraceae bacterium]|nr:hypothetical protein [Lachnospiraceae bacterium]
MEVTSPITGKNLAKSFAALCIAAGAIALGLAAAGNRKRKGVKKYGKI